MRRAVLIFGLIFFLSVGTARSQTISVVRDEEIERTLLFYLTPLFEQAGLDTRNMAVHLVKDDSINAFAAKGLHVFVNTGLLTKADNGQEVVAVLAHETGHIAGGHIVRMYENMQIARRSMLLSMILGSAAVAAGGGTDAAVGAVLGGVNSMQSVFAAYRRSEENAADQTAVTLLEKTGHDFSGFAAIMQKLQSQEEWQTTDGFELWQSHPAVRERLALIVNQPAPARIDAKRIAAENALFDRIRAKLYGFLYPSKKTLERYPETDESLPARYARTIAAYRDGRFKDAMAGINALIADYPDDPYFYELKGQILFETGRAADAVEPYGKAVALLPSSPLMRIGLIQALIEQGDADGGTRARRELAALPDAANDLPLVWRLRAVVYGRSGQTEMADYALAEYNAATGNARQAAFFARKALKKLPDGSAAAVRARDILENAGGEK